MNYTTTGRFDERRADEEAPTTGIRVRPPKVMRCGTSPEFLVRCEYAGSTRDEAYIVIAAPHPTGMQFETANGGVVGSLQTAPCPTDEPALADFRLLTDGLW